MAIPTLVLRTIKGSALTYQEMDSNFQNLANLEVAGGSNYSNTNVAAYLTSQSITSYSNVQVGAYLTTNPPAGTYSNVQVGAYLTTNPPTGTYSNVQVGAYLTTNPPAGTYSNVQVANYLPTYGGNVANLRLGISGGLTFSDGTRMITAATGSGTSSNLFGVRTTFSTSTTMADPGNDTIRFNYLDPGTPSIYEITQIAFSDYYNNAVSNVWLESWNRSTNSIKGAIYIQAAEYDSPAVYHLSSITKYGTAPSSYFVANVNHAAGHPGVTTASAVKHVSFLAFGNTGTGTSGIASVSADTTPSLGGNLNVNNKTITGNVWNKGIEFSFPSVDTTSTLKFSATAGLPAGGANYGGTNGLAYYCGTGEAGSLMLTGNVNNNQPQLKIQNVNTGSGSEAKIILFEASGAGSELAIFKPSANTYSLAPSGSTKYGDGGMYNAGGNLKLYAWDSSTNPAHITFQGLFTSTAADEPFDFNLANGDLRTLGNINLATGKNVYINGVAISAGGSGIANVSVDTTPRLGGNLNPNGFSITANIAHTISDFSPDLQRSKSVFRFENTDTRENLASAITIVGKGKNMRMGVLGNDPTLNGYGLAAGGSFIEGTAGLTSDLWFFNYGNIYTSLGTYISGSGIVLDGGKQVTVGGVALTSYSNVEVASYLTTNPPTGTYSNVQVASYLTTNPPAGTYSNVQVGAYLTVNPPAGTYSNVQVASYVAGNITVGNIAGKTSGFTLGYLEMPQVAAGNVTLALADSGKHFYSTSSAPLTVTVPVNSSVAFPTGTVISIVNQGTANLTIAKGSATLYLSGNATSANRTLTSYGIATLLKVDTDTWFVNGNGVV